MTTVLRRTAPAQVTGLLDAVLVRTWLDADVPGPVAAILIAHPPPHPDEERGELVEHMSGLGAALGLEPVSSHLPDIGPRITARPGSPLTLDVTACGRRLVLPSVARDFAQFVADGGPVIVTLGLDPLDDGVGSSDIDTYLHRSLLADRLAMGTTRRRR